MLTTNVCPALAVTPHRAGLCVSLAVFQSRKGPHRPEYVDTEVIELVIFVVCADVGEMLGAAVRTTVGAAVGA
jgi:hypothetical protein